MNLVKNGAVLLAALSTFAITSCGGTKTQKLDYDAAKEWVSKNYSSTETKEIKQTKVHWDYSKTTGEDEEATKLARQLVAATLKSQFGDDTFTEEEYAKPVFEKTIDGAHCLGGDSLNPLNGENFDENFEDEKENLEFSASGKTLVVTISDVFDAKFAQIDRKDKQTYNEKGYLKTWKTNGDKEDIEYKNKKFSIHLEDILTPIV